jgi:capsid protein
MTPPTAPGAEDYRKSKHRNIATGYEVTYEMMSGDYSQVNFSSGRMGWIEHQRCIDHWQWMTLIPTFCKRAFGWFLE